MEDIYKTPDAELVDNRNTAANPYKLYKVSAVAIATFLGTVFAGGVIMAHNYRQLGLHDAARKILINTGLVTLAILCIAFMLPDNINIPNIAFILPQLFGMHYLAKARQEEAIKTHETNNGALNSNWKAAGISLLIGIGILGLVTLVLLLVYGF